MRQLNVRTALFAVQQANDALDVHRPDIAKGSDTLSNSQPDNLLLHCRMELLDVGKSQRNGIPFPGMDFIEQALSMRFNKRPRLAGKQRLSRQRGRSVAD